MYQLNPALLDSDSSESKSNLNSKKSANKTIKNKNNIKFDTIKEETKPKLTNINNLHSSYDSDDETENNFSMQYTSSLNDKNINNQKNSYNEDLINNELKKMNKFNINQNDIINNNDNNNNLVKNLDNTNYSNFNNSYKSTYDFIDNNNEQSYQSNILNNNQLISKLDYIIHLLEEQHNEKTNHITEELILYLFLGIFMIYVLDSFTKASKYIR